MKDSSQHPNLFVYFLLHYLELLVDLPVCQLQPILASRNGGNYWLRWSRDGKHLYYESSQNEVASVDISTTPRLSASAPKIAWDLGALRTVSDGSSSLFDLLPDGNLLVIQKGEDEDDLTRFDVAFNFFEEMRAKLRKGSKR